MDSATCKIHPDGTRALQETALNPSAVSVAGGPPTVMWLPRMLEPPSRSRSRQQRPKIPRKGVSFSIDSVSSTTVAG